MRKILAKDSNETHFGYEYLVKYSGQKINFERQEMSEVKFFTKEELGLAIKAGEKFGPESVKVAREIWMGEFCHVTVNSGRLLL